MADSQIQGQDSEEKKEISSESTDDEIIIEDDLLLVDESEGANMEKVVEQTVETPKSNFSEEQMTEILDFYNKEMDKQVKDLEDILKILGEFLDHPRALSAEEVEKVKKEIEDIRVEVQKNRDKVVTSIQDIAKNY